MAGIEVIPHTPKRCPQENHSQHPLEAAVVLCVDTLQVLQVDGQPQQLLVEGQGEASVNVQAMEHCQPNDTPHKEEVGYVLLRGGREGGRGEGSWLNTCNLVIAIKVLASKPLQHKMWDC